jgi:hypothetical protein
MLQDGQDVAVQEPFSLKGKTVVTVMMIMTTLRATAIRIVMNAGPGLDLGVEPGVVL